MSESVRWNGLAGEFLPSPLQTADQGVLGAVKILDSAVMSPVSKVRVARCSMVESVFRIYDELSVEKQACAILTLEVESVFSRLANINPACPTGTQMMPIGPRKGSRCSSVKVHVRVMARQTCREGKLD